VKPNFTPVAQEVFERRYRFKKETPEGMIRRVAKALAAVEERPAEWEERFYELMADLRFLPNSPTLFNAGTGQGLLSACFLFVVEDSLESIMECQRLSGLVQKFGGGVGYALSKVRPAGQQIKSVQGRACGPVALLDYYNSLAELITQGGKRAGAQMAILSAEHADAEAFIHAKDERPDDLSTFNISLALTDEFMSRATNGDKKAKKLLREMAESAWRTGDPGCYFIDAANRGNPTPWLGTLDGSNPCGEVPLLHAEACNLGSLNLAKYVNGERTDLDWDQLERDAKLAVRLLDNVVTANTFPDPVITKAVELTRKIGLGVMGWADTLALLGVHYDSAEAIKRGEEVIDFIRKVADETSSQLGDEKGPAPAYRERPKHQAFRNATRLSIAPTGSIAILAGCSSGIEPHYALEYTRRMNDRGKLVELSVREPVIDRLEELGSTFRPRTALEIAPTWHIQHQAVFQQHVDLAVSKTINLLESATVEDIEEAYVTMWRLGCKGGTIYRDKCRDQQVLGDLRRKVGERRKLPDTRHSTTHRFSVGDQKGYFTVGMYDDNTPGEIFITISKEGSTTAGVYDAFATMVSLSLQYGVPLESITTKLMGSRFEPSGFTKNPDIPNATSIVDYITRWLGQKFIGKPVSVKSGQPCPDCGADLIYQEGCLRCGSCAYSRC